MFELTFPPETKDGVLREYDAARTILEYGTGGSTVYAVKDPQKRIYAVETDASWLDELTKHIQKLQAPGRMVPVHGDIGPTVEWGRPKDMSFKASFPFYALKPWQIIEEDQAKVDLVLIDGRFRVACFLASAAFIKKPTKIIVDDYVGRASYSLIEQVFEPIELLGRAAVFEVEPNRVSADFILRNLNCFYDAN